MDPRDTPGYRLHRALSNISNIDIDELDPADRKRIDTAVTLLEQVSLLTRPPATEDAGVQVES
ncbi:hypothetical protein RH831_11525 [Halodesulfurarchaeum sp. HSR-GB]|uniref:hypothetical protein n=1 Tax=Halodesulfurarchaeum sp. HSR-GB TaxID=3074077 RepID=UPI002867092E|nr:hypothetical protein [Halodesulfurarchaeum sp. HSR-GB]MDR5657801.1 hypothetical protein [Halodesulfurarchaeum sp. HSR-GB]